jgi:hypothetical protein
MMRIFQQSENVYNAADCVVAHGYAAVSGTLSSALPYCDRILKVLSAYDEISPVKSYLNVEKQGYLYFVYDTNRFTLDEVAPFIKAVDQSSSL